MQIVCAPSLGDNGCFSIICAWRLDLCCRDAVLRSHSRARYSLRDCKKPQSPASRLDSRCRLGKSFYAPRPLAISLDLGDALPAGSRLGMVEQNKTSIDPRAAFATFEERIARLEQRLPDDSFKQRFVPKKPERIVVQRRNQRHSSRWES